MIQDETRRCEKFYMGLRASIRDFIPSWRDYSDLVQISLRIEMSIKVTKEKLWVFTQQNMRQSSPKADYE